MKIVSVTALTPYEIQAKGLAIKKQDFHVLVLVSAQGSRLEGVSGDQIAAAVEPLIEK